MGSRHFIAELWFNCDLCEDLVEPGDEAGRLADWLPAAISVCAACLADVERTALNEDEPW